MALDPEEIFFRAFRHAEFDICELSLSSFTVKTAQGRCAYVGVPAFVSRAFRHTSIYVRTDRIKKPADLKGSKVGVPEYQLTANVWARAMLEDDYGVKPSDIHWIRGGLEEAGPAREDRRHAAAGGEARERAGRAHDLRACWRRARSTPSSAPRAPSLLRARQAERRLAVCRSDGGREGLFQARPASSRSCISSACAARWSSSIPGCRPRCSRPSTQRQGDLRWTLLERHLGHQGDAAVRRGAGEGGARR